MAQRVIAGDDFADFYSKFNANADGLAAGVLVTTNGTIELRNDLDAEIFNYDSGGSKGFVLEGLAVSFEGSSVSEDFAALIQVGGGQYAWQNKRYEHDLTVYGLYPPEAFPRIDVVRANENGVAVLTGTATEYPTAPEANGVALAYLNVYPNGRVSILPTLESLKDAPQIIDVTGGNTPIIPNNRNNIIVKTGAALDMPTEPYDGQTINIKNETGGTISLSSTSTFNGSASPYSLTTASQSFTYIKELNDWAGIEGLDLPSGMSLGDVLFWNGSNWQPTGIVKVGVFEGVQGYRLTGIESKVPYETSVNITINGNYSDIIALAGVTDLTLPTAGTLPTGVKNGYTKTVKNRTGGNINIQAADNIDGVAAPFVMANKDTYTFKYSNATGDWNVF